MQQAAGDHKQMPNAVGMAQTMIQGKKDNPHRVHHTARGQPDKPGRAERGNLWGHAGVAVQRVDRLSQRARAIQGDHAEV